MEKTVNERVKELRTHLNLSQTEFGGRIEIGQVSVYKIESGENKPSFRTLKAISNAFNVNPEWLNTGKGEMFLEKKQVEEQASNPWKDALVVELKDEVMFLKKQTEWLQQLVNSLTNGAKPNFLKALERAGVSTEFLGRTYSGAKAA